MVRLIAVQSSGEDCVDMNETDEGHTPKERSSGIVVQPKIRPITSDQLALEVKNIYSNLVAVEAKCINLDSPKLCSDSDYVEFEECEKWQAMIPLYQTLLYEHHDFLSASQHPATNESLTKLALKYSTPARMWKHGIQSFLEVLRHRLPESIDHMLQFIYTAYEMMALLYETLETFKATLVDCIRDIVQWRVSKKDGGNWATVASSWYCMASDTNPQTGRLYHHLGTLARPNVLQQLFFHYRASICIKPFPNAQESLPTLLAPVFACNPASGDNLDVLLVRLRHCCEPSDHFPYWHRETQPWHPAGYGLNLGPLYYSEQVQVAKMDISPSALAPDPRCHPLNTLSGISPFSTSNTRRKARTSNAAKMAQTAVVAMSLVTSASAYSAREWTSMISGTGGLITSMGWVGIYDQPGDQVPLLFHLKLGISVTYIVCAVVFVAALAQACRSPRNFLFCDLVLMIALWIGTCVYQGQPQALAVVGPLSVIAQAYLAWYFCEQKRKNDSAKAA